MRLESRVAGGSKVVKFDGTGWTGVAVRHYKDGDGRHGGVTRRVLLGERPGEEALNIVTRYFEVASRGYSTLERHQHPHTVIVVRGTGRVVLDDTIYAVEPYDCVYVAPDTLHQFQASDDESLGFLCIVDRDRDRPKLPSVEDVERLTRAGIPTKPGT